MQKRVKKGEAHRRVIATALARLDPDSPAGEDYSDDKDRVNSKKLSQSWSLSHQKTA